MILSDATYRGGGTGIRRHMSRLHELSPNETIAVQAKHTVGAESYGC